MSNALAERFLPQLVHDARVNDHTWHQIAHALGASPDTDSPTLIMRLMSVASDGC